MQLDLQDAKHATRTLGQEATMNALTRRPTFVVVKAHWCPHCVAVEKDLKDLTSSMQKSNINFLTMELDAYERAAADHQATPLMSMLLNDGAGKAGVPYLALVLPEGEVLPYNGMRSALPMAKFILDGLKTKKVTRRR